MTLWLHIGTPKTGSSSLQHFLEANLERLRERGIVVPRSASRLSHRQLKIYALDDDVIDNLRRAKEYTTLARITHFRKKFRARLAQEATGWRADEQVVMTCEQLTDLRTPSAIARLADLLRPFGHAIKVVLYVRRQDQLLPSLYVQRVRGGLTDTLETFVAQAPEVLFHYDRLLADWAREFGDAAIFVRPFERSQLVRGSVVDDFMSLTGMETLDGLIVPPDQNASLSAACTEFLRRLNPHVPRWVDGRQNPVRRTIVRAVEALPGGEKIRLSATEACTVLRAFEAGNAEVARRWLGRADGRLFHDPIDDRPAVSSRLDAGEAAALTAALAQLLAQPQG